MASPTNDRECDVASLADTLRKREPLLSILADGPRDQRDLRDDLDVSRSTVYKSLQELEAVGLVTDSEGGYRLTGFGRLAWQRHDTYLARLQRLDEARPLLDAIPSEWRVPLSVFEHGRITIPGRHAPERPLTQLEKLGLKADRLRVASPAGMPRYLADIHESVAADELQATLVVESDGLDRLQTGYDRFEAAVATDDLDICLVDDTLPFAIALFDDSYIALFAYDEGILVGATFSHDPGAVRWGERVFADIRERSESV